MQSIQNQSLTEYGTWLDYEYHIHMTTRLVEPGQTAQQLNRLLTHEILSPLQSYIHIRIAAVSVITIEYTQQHVHSLLYSPDRTIHKQEVDRFVRYMTARRFNSSIFDHDNYIIAKEHHADRKAYVYEHLTNQNGSLHFFNRKDLRLNNE